MATPTSTGSSLGQRAPVPELLIDQYLPAYDVVITETLVVPASAGDAWRAARDLDFMTVRSPLLLASMWVRGLPARIRRTTPPPPPELRLASPDADRSAGLPGWLVLGEDPGHELAFGAVGKFWKSDIEWLDLPRDQFTGFNDPGWGKIACHFRVRPTGIGTTAVTYECRTATTDADARRQMSRYWWLIRPFVGHIMRATLRTIAAQAAEPTVDLNAR